MRIRRLALVLAFAASSAHARIQVPFPDGFLWGTAISGFQSDMGLGAPNDPNSDWWVWVHDAANVASEVVSGDLPEDGPGYWLRFADDAKLARKKVKLNAQRLGIEWSRIFPTSTASVDGSGGIGATELAALDALASQSAVSHYRDVFTALRARRLEPMLTLNHFSLPTWIHDPIGVRDAYAGVDPFSGVVPSLSVPGGWLDAVTIGEFEKLAAYAAWKFGDLVDLWCTLNEPATPTDTPTSTPTLTVTRTREPTRTVPPTETKTPSGLFSVSGSSCAIVDGGHGDSSIFPLLFLAVLVGARRMGRRR